MNLREGLVAGLLAVVFITEPKADPMTCKDLYQFIEISAHYRDSGVPQDKYGQELYKWSEEHPQQVTLSEATQAIELIEFVYMNPTYTGQQLAEYAYERCNHIH
jgi:hypothetical protein